MGSLLYVLGLATCFFLQTAWGKEFCENLSIIGGHNVNIQDAPYIAAIYDDNSVICVGTIVHERFILTAASCGFCGGNVKVVVGTAQLNTRGRGQLYYVEKEICHDDFDSISMKNDICLLKLRSDIEFGNTVSKIRLPHRYTYIDDGTLLNVTGWGSIDTTGKRYPNKLQQTSVPKVSKQCCSESYDDITDEMICAGKIGHDACEGDEGAPLTIENYLIGVYSTGASGGCGLAPGVYTKVTAYLDWIETKIKQNS